MLPWLQGAPRSLPPESLLVAGREWALSRVRKHWPMLRSWERWWGGLTLPVLSPASILAEAPSPVHRLSSPIVSLVKGSHLVSGVG